MLNAMSNVRDETTSSGASLTKRVKDHVENASKRVDISGRTPCKTELSRQCVGQVSKIVSPLPTQSLRVLHRVGRDMLRMGGKDSAPTVSVSTEKTTTQKTTTSKKKRKSDASNTSSSSSNKSTKKRKSDPVVSVLSETKNNVAPPRSTRKKRRATVHTPQDIKKHAAAASSKKKRRQRRASSIPLPGDENSTKKWNTPQRRGSSKLRRPSRRSLQ